VWPVVGPAPYAAHPQVVDDEEAALEDVVVEEEDVAVTVGPTP
jgi:hypothetical protein